MNLKKLPNLPPEKLIKEEIQAKTQALKHEMEALQRKLYAEAKHSVLIILQGIDASGKDGLIKNVFTGLNPQGVRVKSFKAPTSEDLAHDFLWRIHKVCPEKGMIKVFNRSHYEDVLVPLVEKFVDKKAIEKRYKHINDFEEMLMDNGTIILKFYLHISYEEQYKRLLERKTNPDKHWKHNDGDWETREKWVSYMDAYEKLFKKCNSPEWNIIPSDKNWYKEYLVAEKIVGEMKMLV